jgi:UDP-GlcNAc:undecaprenyl-phosphate GlcNAc-1-phosphate transferase
MRTYIAAFVASAVVAAILTPLIRFLAIRVGAVSPPGGRHIHRAAIPRLGGIAIFVAFLVPVASLFFIDSGVGLIVFKQGAQAVGLIVGASAMALVGVIDDTRGLRAIYKLAVQVVVACVAFGCGLRIEVITLPVFGNVAMGVFALPATVLWITGIVNAVNLIDGLDGLAAGVVLFAGITNFVIATMAGSVFIAFMMAALGGAVLGFLLFNFNPARIFMGDSGSYLLGYVLATTALVADVSTKASTAVSLLVPCLALGVPIFDTLFTMVRRYLERRPMFSPDRGHLHHRLIDMGLTHRRAVLTIYGVSIVFSVSAIAITFGHGWQIGLALLVACAVLFALVRFAGYFEYLKMHLRGRGRLQSRQAEALRGLLPDLPIRLARVESHDELFAALDEVGARLGLDGLELSGKLDDAVGHVWRRPGVDTSNPHSSTVSSLLVGDEGRARAIFTLAWPPEHGPVGSDATILLQVFVDMMERALERLRSPLAPEPPTPRVAPTEPTSEVLLGPQRT